MSLNCKISTISYLLWFIYILCFTFLIMPNLLIHDYLILVIVIYIFGFLGLINMMQSSFLDPGYIKDFKMF